MANSLITVIGSINMDMVTVTNSVPKQGETKIGEAYRLNPGGKGANQAISAARLGADIQMIGMVGDDQHGTQLLENLDNEGVSTEMIKKTPEEHTGIANIIVSGRDNRIIVIPGANDKVTSNYVKQFEKEILRSDLVLLQFEIPLETVLYCLEFCNLNGIPIIVNPAPAKSIAKDHWMKATYITPNENEAYQLFDKKNTVNQLTDRLVITKGAYGVSYYIKDKQMNIPAHLVTPVDTTGAGDTFNGALSVAVSEKEDLSTAIRFANAASALSIQKFGAQEGMPTRKEVEYFLRKNKKY